MQNSDFTSNELVIFKSSQTGAEFEVILDGEHDTIWVTEQQITELFGKARRTIGEHIRNIYKEGELDQGSTWRKFRQVQIEGEREVSRTISAYNLDVVISVGYRVKLPIGVEFRKWATQIKSGKHAHAFGRNDLRPSRNGQTPDLTDGFDSFTFNDNHRIANRVASKTVDQRASDEGFEVLGSRLE